MKNKLEFVLPSEEIDFETGSSVEIEVESGDSFCWDGLNLNDVEFNLFNASFGKSSRIKIVDTVVNGDLFIHGAGVDLEVVEIINCEISGKIVLENIRAGKIRIVGRANFLDFRKVDFGDIYICGEFKAGIIMDSLNGIEIEVNGYSSDVFLNDLKLAKVKFLNFHSDLIEGWGLDIGEASIPTGNKINFGGVTFNYLNLLDGNKKTGSIYHLRDAYLRI